VDAPSSPHPVLKAVSKPCAAQARAGATSFCVWRRARSDDIGDTGSLRAALTIADVVLVPFQPRSVDLWASGQVGELVAEAKVINCARAPRGVKLHRSASDVV
jgi:hypothetical protein